jgi:hypothetical protein
MDDMLRVRALIEAQMPQKSWAQLERETGLDNLPRRLLQAARQRYIPLEVVAAVHQATGITVGELIFALSADAGYHDLLPYEVDSETVGLLRELLQAAPAERALVAAWLDWMRWARGGGEEAPPPSGGR